MSIMGMREWFRKNRITMVVIFVLLLIGLLISYGRFGASSTYTAADYEKMVTQAREAYASDPKAPENVYGMYQALATYVDFLSHNKGEQEQIKTLDAEAVGYYDEYYALLAEEAKAAYQAEPNYTNAYMLAQYLYERARAQASMEGMDGGVAMQKEMTNWLVVAMGHRVDEINVELAETPDDAAKLADLADAVGALAYYKHEQDNTYDVTPEYQQSLDLYQQAIANIPADLDPSVAVEYYVGAASCAYNLDDIAKAEEFYKSAIALAPDNYNANVGYASLMLNVGRIDESLEFLNAYQAMLKEDDPDYASVQQYIESVQALKEQLDNPPEPEDDGEENGDENQNGEGGENNN
ncbi:MAG: tetratricopeptide repeat protein [Firmicutes bacterium]|nr:tetratricopeptide repeat protein [Bacillota bacterium]